MKSFQRNTQPAAVRDLQPIEVPLRVLVSEPDITSRRLICALLQSDAETSMTCVEDSQLLSAVRETAAHIVVVDVHSPSIRRALNWETLGIQEVPATIVTGFDPSVVSTFASNAVDFLVKPFDVKRLESALDLATAAIGPARFAERFFNLFNHPNFAFSNTNADSGQFGQITQTVSQPTTIYGSGLGADAFPRVIELQARFVF